MPTSSPRTPASASSRYALAVAQIGSEAVLKLFPEPEPHPRVFDGLVRFLDLLDRGIDDGPDPVRDGVGLGFQLKLLALAGYLPHLDSCAGCGSGRRARRLLRRRRGRRVRAVRDRGRCVSPELREPGAIASLVDRPLAPGSLATGPAADAVRVVEATYAYHGGSAFARCTPEPPVWVGRG